MRKTLLALSALAAVAITTSAANRSEASPLVNPTALSGAIDDLALVDNVHCRPGWRHHSPRSWRRADGCARRGATIVVPGQTRYVWRGGVRVRIGDRDRGARTVVRSGDRTTVRSRTDVRVREGGGREAIRTGRGGRDGDRNVDVRRGGGATQGRGGATQGGGSERGGTMMQDRGGGAQKGGGSMQKGGGGMQKDGGGAQKGGKGQNPQ
jgi:hypothetical protein